MIIRSAFGLRLDFSEGLNRLRAGARWRWLPATLAFYLLPAFMLAQIAPGTSASQPAESASILPSPAVSAFTPISGSVPSGYILTAPDQVAFAVFSADDLRTNGG